MTKLFINAGDRKRHVYISGKTQHGKSTLIRAMVDQDVKNGEGLCVIDGKGDMAHKLLDWVPEHRRNDVIYLDLSTPIPIDFMACENEDERMTLVSDIIQIFERMDDGLGIRMDAIIRFTVASLGIIGGGTFLDIYRVITDQGFRDKIRKHPKIQQDPYLSLFWNQQAEKIIKGESGIAIAVSRMSRFIISDSFRIILGTRDGLNIADAIEDNKIIFVKLKPNSDDANLFGSLIVSKVQQAIYRRDPEKLHRPFMLYVDEFQRFKTSGFDEILATGGGLGLCLTLVNQYFDQLLPDVRSAIVNSVSTFFLFRMGKKNAAELAGELKEPEQLYSPADQIKELKQEEKGLLDWLNGLPDEDYGPQNEIWRGFNKRLGAIDEELSQLQSASPHKTFLERLPHLPVGQAVYRAADGSTTIIKTASPHIYTSSKPSYAAFIKWHTIDEYGLKTAPSAENDQKRTEGEPPCNEAQIRHDENYDYRSTSAAKPEVEPGGAPSDIPPHNN